MAIVSLICLTVAVVVGIICGTLLAKRQQDAQHMLLMADMQRNAMAQLHRNSMEMERLISNRESVKSPGDCSGCEDEQQSIQKIEFGWLIERKSPDGPRWAVFNEGGVDWTKDSDEACRFARKSDAEQLGFGDDVDSITAHQWLS